MTRTLTLVGYVRLWLRERSNPWCRPREGWLSWVLFGRVVECLADPVCEGVVHEVGPAFGMCKTVVVNRGMGHGA